MKGLQVAASISDQSRRCDYRGGRVLDFRDLIGYERKLGSLANFKERAMT